MSQEVPEKVVLPHKIESEIIEGKPKISILRCSGSFFEGPAQAALKSSIQEIINRKDDPINYLIVNLSKANDINPPGLGALLNAMKILRQQSGELYLVVAEKTGIDLVLNNTGLSVIFDIFATEEETEKEIRSLAIKNKI